MKKPFFIINPKNYLNLNEIIDLAIYADELALKLNVNLLFTTSFPYLSKVIDEVQKIRVVAQHVDYVEDGLGMGKVSVKALKDIGVKAVVLNHVENPISFGDLIKIIKQCNEYNMETIVCCDTISEAKVIAKLNATAILYENKSLIGGGKPLDLDSVKKINDDIRRVNKNILIEHAAGVKNEDDVFSIIVAGSDGTGATSGIVKAANPKKALHDMVSGLIKARKHLKELKNGS